MSTQMGCKESDHNLKEKLINLQLLKDGLQSATNYMARENVYEDAIIFVGSTKSGKSTLINYLIGNKLEGKKVEELFSKFSIIKADNSPGPTIGVKPTSETVFPTRWKSRQPIGLAIWDAPGFDDNRGVIQDITNAFYIYKLFQNLKSAKIVLVTDINDIVQDNTRPFLTLLNSVEEILKEKMEICSNGIAIIFSKVPKEIFENPGYKKIISKHYLENKFLSSGLDISPNAKNFIRHIISNDGKIGFFKQASLADVNQPITDISINEGIFEAIQNTREISEQILKQVSPCISERSRIFLYGAREQLCCTKIFTQLQELLRKICTESIPDSGEISITNISQEELLQQSQKLENSKKKLIEAFDPTIKTFEKKIDAIRMIDPAVKKLIDEQNLLLKATFMEFVDRLLGYNYSKDFEIDLQIILTAAKSKIQESLLGIKLKNQEISSAEAKAESSKILQQFKVEDEKLKKEKEVMKIHNEAVIRQLNEKINEMAAAQERKNDYYEECINDLKSELRRRYGVFYCHRCGYVH